MTTFIRLAAQEYLDVVENAGLKQPPGLDNDQLVAVLDELEVIRTSPDNKHARAERGRIAVELFAFNDDVETMAADVIADILHYVALTASPDHVAPAVFRGIGYFLEERN